MIGEKCPKTKDLCFQKEWAQAFFKLERTKGRIKGKS